MTSKVLPRRANIWMQNDTPGPTVANARSSLDASNDYPPLDAGDAAEDDVLLDDLEDGKKRVNHEADHEVDITIQLVRKVVPLGDDPDLPALTLRVFAIGLSLCVLGAGISTLLFFKSNAPSFSSFFVVLVSLPMGNLMATWLPAKRVRWGPFDFSLNPGPYSIKEHVLTVITAVSGSSAAYGGDILAVQDLYYHQEMGAVGGLLLILTTQLIGFGLSGLVYDLLVRPTAMVWPSNLAVVTLFNTLHAEKNATTTHRLRFFYVAFLACFAWQFMPGLFAPTLTSLAVLCMINNDSPTMRAMGSGYSGFGLFNISLDWSVLGAVGGLVTPFWASLNFFVGLAGMVYVVAPLLYTFDFWGYLSFPVAIDSNLYKSDMQIFNVTNIIKPDLSLDEVAFEQQRPLLLNPVFAITYGLSFAVLTSAISTVLLWHSKSIVDAFSSYKSPPDEHVQLLERNYPGVPKRWYYILGGSMLGLSVFLVMFYPLQLPVWALFLSIAIAVVFLIPCGIIAATTDTVIGLNVITEMVIGLLLPGLPIANITFKCYGYMSMVQALDLVRDLKLGLYLKIPPRAMFLCQALGTAVGSVVNYCLIKSVINSKREYLDGTLEDPTGQYTGRGPHIFYSASVVWGLIGPARFFTGRYSVLYWGFPIGILLPFIPWYVNKRYPALGKRLHLDKISFPLILHAATGPPQVPTNVVITGFITAFLSQHYALRRHPKWFTKYNYVLSSALDAATSVNAMTIYAFGLSALAPTSWWNSAIDTEHCKPGS